MDFTMLGAECNPIEGAHNRAITLRQLRRLRDFILSHVEDADGTLPWIDMSPPEYSQTSGQKLNAHTINLYQVWCRLKKMIILIMISGLQVNDWIIKPATEATSCSMVELMCEPGTVDQTPRWFVSHCWCACPCRHIMPSHLALILPAFCV